MKKLIVVLILAALQFKSQLNNRIFPQPPPSMSIYIMGDVNPIIKTSDNGYLISANPWSPNIHAALPVDFMTIKTNSLLIPSWKKIGFIKSLRLPTGRLITMQQSINTQVYSISQLTKMDNAGQAIWTKSVTTNMLNHITELKDMVVFGNKIVAVGSDFYNDPFFVNSSQTPFIMEFDTSGAVQGIHLGAGTSSTSSVPRIVFDKIIRMPSGDYLVSDAAGYALHKFSTTYNQVFSLKQATRKLRLVDACILSNQDIFCLLQNEGAYLGDTNSVLLKIAPTGSFIACYEIPLFAKYGGMEKTNYGKFIITGMTYRKNSSDTTRNFIMMVDSVGTFYWGRKQLPSIGISKPYIENTKVMYGYYSKDLAVITGDQNGNFPCTNSPMTLTLIPKSMSFVSSPITLMTTQMTQTTGFTYSNTTQTYLDSCASLITGIKKNNLDDTRFWPNPTKGIIHVSNPLDEDRTIAVFSLDGNLVLKITGKAEEADLTGLPAGMYCVQVSGGGNLGINRKIVLLE